MTVHRSPITVEGILPVAKLYKVGSGLNCNHLLFSGIGYEALVSSISSKTKSIFKRSDIGIYG
ncbi:MAG: hypothetical protein AAGG00_13395 [Cyanobacteria bacterium P01_H01_bin.150]